ncbi:EexN family lipoprotein [Campylobacter sp. faydin G-24]|uniref:EexN family lipoprotein n=1 Tax=Campylobacter anatolicus TaxID=2829105 RepID=A0ABS5HIN7_9BACT|nr:EexN family lipoprotein [Campylobacter anatolicus]MBR8463993.1 EexN family lipoprotein [Campylobacter anatolicus]
MKQIVAGSILVVGLFSLTGCFEQEIKTAEYFKNHPEEMEKVITKCQKAEKMTDSQKQECENAFKAQAMKRMGTGLGDDFFEDKSPDKNQTK